MLEIIETILKETDNGRDIAQKDIPRIKYRIDTVLAQQGNDKMRKMLAPIVMRDELVHFMFRDPNAEPIKKQPDKPKSTYWTQDGGRDY